MDTDVGTTFLPTKNIPREPKLYKTRWLILTLYILYAAINAFQWFEYSIITNIIMKFYNISPVGVDWTAIIYTVLYMPMVVPASYLMERTDLRKTALIGMAGTALGTTLKIFTLCPDRVWVTYLAQTILSSMQVFILALPPRIAAVWFGPKEVSLACALGIFGTQLGQALGFIVPPMVVKNGDVAQIGDNLGKLVYGLAIFAVVVALAVVAYFPAKPPSPPNNVEAKDEKRNFVRSLLKLFSDRNFNFHAVAYGINIAVFVAISTLLNQFMLFYFPNSEQDAGRIGLIMVLFGMMGSIIFGYILDKTHKYKETTVAIYVLSLVAVTAFMYSLKSRSLTSVYITGALVGLFTNAYMPVGLELAIELTYPEPESTSSGILISMTQTFGALFTLLLGWLFSTVGCFWALTSMNLFLLVGAILTALISNTMKRQMVFNQQINKQ